MADLKPKRGYMRVIEGGWIYTKDEFLEEQATWPDEDMFKEYEPTKNYIVITDDGLLVETNNEEEYQ